MLKNETKEKKGKKQDKKNEKNYNYKKTTTKNIKKIQQKRERPKKRSGWKGRRSPQKNICPEFLPESFSFLFMKLYRNVYQIKTMCGIQLWLHFLIFQSYGPLIVF